MMDVIIIGIACTIIALFIALKCERKAHAKTKASFKEETLGRLHFQELYRNYLVRECDFSGWDLYNAGVLVDDHGATL